MITPSHTVEIGTLPVGSKVLVYFAGKVLKATIEDHIIPVGSTMVRMDEGEYYCSFPFATQVQRRIENV